MKGHTVAQILVTIRNVYGNRVIYPHCSTAQNFARLAGTKTLTPEALRKIRALGFEVAEYHPSQLDEVLK